MVLLLWCSWKVEVMFRPGVSFYWISFCLITTAQLFKHLICNSPNNLICSFIQYFNNYRFIFFILGLPIAHDNPYILLNLFDLDVTTWPKLLTLLSQLPSQSSILVYFKVNTYITNKRAVTYLDLAQLYT